MTPFLKQTAMHYAGRLDAADRVFVFPNRRSMQFFEMYYRQAMTEMCPERPFAKLELTTISAFFEQASNGQKATDKVSLLVELYECYKALDKTGETLDDFIYWGDIILSDFDDIDKYLVPAESLFTNITDIKDMADDCSYMTEEQKAAILKLAGHFSAGKWSNRGKGVKAGFLTIWQILLPLYRNFRERLAGKGMAYEGMIYRNLADRLSGESVADILKDGFSNASGFVFVGLNALNECEKLTLSKMRDARLAEFCWDFPGKMIGEDYNVANHFMEPNLVNFPSVLNLESDCGKPSVHIVSVPSATGQAKLLPAILRDVPDEEKALDFAVVLPDETMLSAVLGSIPEDVPDVNVTMGYPLVSSEFYSFMRDALALQLHVRFKGGTPYFYYKQVYALFSSGVLRSVLAEEQKDVIAAIRKGAKYYIPLEDFGESALFKLLFSPVVTDMSSTDAAQIRALATWQLDLVKILTSLSGPEEILNMECAFRYYRAVNVLKEKNLAVMPQTWAHLVAQTAAALSVPFEGEPLGGMQVMGPLETRALDFKRIVILNSSEGVFPRRSVSSSFVPPELRKAFGLPTYEYQDAVWAYYFYRMIARAQDVWMIYDSRTDGNRSGEESRYIKQLRYLYDGYCHLDEAVASAEVRGAVEDGAIPKTAEDVEFIRGLSFSASSVQKYISCPAAFYYQVVKELRPDQEVTETLDPGLLGTVCHDTLQALYCSEEQMRADVSFDKRKGEGQWDKVPHMDIVTKDYLKSWLVRKEDIRQKVLSLARHHLHTIEVTGRDLVAVDIAVRFVMKVISRDIELIERHGPLKILGLEKEYRGVSICGHKFVGYIDRLDSFADGTLRIVDYKTGSDKPSVLKVGSAPQPAADAIFDKNKAHANKAALQFYIYDKFVASERCYDGLEKVNAMYAVSDIFSSPVEAEPVSAEFENCVDERLSALFKEMEDPDVPFRRSDSIRECKYCDYRMLCGRVTKD